MKRNYFTLTAALGALLCTPAATSHAGDYNTVQQMPASTYVYGSGFYGAIDLGANVHQDRGGDEFFTNDFGDTLVVSPKDNVGFYGGVKLGYVFGQGAVRFALEEDMFYNGFRGGADTTLTVNGDVIRHSSGTSYINTGAFMTNAIVKFGNGRFQPYIGGGIGFYYAESADLEINSPRGTFSTEGGKSHTDLAWQIIAGADYYWNPKFSTFLEYHYLDYTSENIDTATERDLGQHLIGAGLRFHF